MGLFGDKTEVAITLDRDDVVIGGTLHVRVRVGAPDKKVQGGRVELAYKNTYKHDTTDSDGDRVTRTRTDVVVVATVPMAGGGVPQAGEMTYALTVPMDAPGTALKSVEWTVRAVVDRKMGSDATASLPIYVRVPAQQLATWAATPPTIPPECGMAFDVQSRLVLPGQRIAGTLSLHAAVPISAGSLELRLRRVRYDPDNNIDAATVAAVLLAERPELAAGDVRALPFVIDVPPDAPPSFHAANNSQCWHLEAVFNRKLRSDITGSLQLVVHTA